ncbi:sigma-70 family RNA polymerase sigma factor [soil metagenome]
MATASDEALLAGIASGDEAAARTFVRRYQQRVFGLAVSILDDRHGAEDVAQEAFVRVWRHAATFDARRADAATWVLTITRNAAIDAVRLRRATLASPEVLLALARPAPGAGPDQEAVDGSQLDRIRTALAGLPAEQRQAVLLAAYLGRTAAEVAEAESIPLGTAKTRIRTGLGKLRAGLADGPVPAPRVR